MNSDPLRHEVTYKATRSGGAGGQHVNKTSTRVELYWDLAASQTLSEDEKTRAREVLAPRLTQEGILILSADRSRSQLKNKQVVTEKFIRLLENAVRPPRVRKPTRVPAAVKRKRLENKRLRAEVKANRRAPRW